MTEKSWLPASAPENEKDRLECLRRYHILDTGAEEAFDRITRLASRLLHAPIVLISLIDENRQWFKSRVGLDAQETHRNLAFCGHAILGNTIMVVPDASKDMRFAGNPLVIGAPDIRFYAGVPLTSPDGYQLGTLCAIDRVPHDGLTEEEREILSDLGAMVISEMELRRSKHVVEEASQAKSDFLANMSHEIRTPLNGILVTAELLRETSPSDYQLKYIATIQSAGENLLVLLNDVLDVSKIEANKLKLFSENFVVRQVLTTTFDLFANSAQAKQLAFSYDIDPRLPETMVADYHRLRQVISNLISNAIKYTETGSIKITVDARTHDDGDFFYFEVHDTGMGISKESHSLIFSKFEQVHGSSAISGTGLGLAICRSLIDLMSGTIGFDSEKGVGSRFWFEVPLCKGKAVGNPIPVQSVSSADSLQGCRILLAEDVEVNRIILAEMLTKSGCVVDPVINGQEAVDKEKINTYDIVLMDCRMPVMDGIAATRAIRAGGNLVTPIIAVSAHAFVDEVQECLKAGMNDHIAKPIRKNDLLAIIKKWYIAGGVGSEVSDQSVPAEQPNFSTAILDTLLQELPIGIEQIVDMTLGDADERYNAITEACRAGDFAQVDAWAHALKSITRQVGGLAVSDMAALIEQAARAGRHDEVLELFDKMQPLYREFCDYMWRARGRK